MKVASLVELVLTNAALLIFYLLVTQDDAVRYAYWHSIGFTPAFNYGPLVFVLSSTNGSTMIPGLLTLDWAQLFLVCLVIVDGLFAIETVLRRSPKP